MNTEDNPSPESATGWGDGSAPVPCAPDCEANHQHYYPKTDDDVATEDTASSPEDETAESA